MFRFFIFYFPFVCCFGLLWLLVEKSFLAVHCDCFPLFQTDCGGRAAKKRRFLVPCLFGAVLLHEWSAALPRDHWWSERSLRSDPLERGSRGRRKPGRPGDRSNRARPTMPDLLGAALYFRAQPRARRARCARPYPKFLRVSDRVQNLRARRSREG